MDPVAPPRDRVRADVRATAPEMQDRGPARSVSVRNYGDPIAADPPGGWGGWGPGEPDPAVWAPPPPSGATTPLPPYHPRVPPAPPPPPPPSPRPQRCAPSRTRPP